MSLLGEIAVTADRIKGMGLNLSRIAYLVNEAEWIEIICLLPPQYVSQIRDGRVEVMGVWVMRVAGEWMRVAGEEGRV